MLSDLILNDRWRLIATFQTIANFKKKKTKKKVTSPASENEKKGKKRTITHLTMLAKRNVKQN